MCHLRLYWGGPDDLVGVLLTGLVGRGEAGATTGPKHKHNYDNIQNDN